MQSDNDRDLILQLSDDAETAVKNGAISIDAFSVRDIVNDIKPDQLDRYSDSLLYEAYFVAKKCRSASRSVIAKKLGISIQLYDYYCEKYPKFRTVIQMGVADAKDEMKETLISSLFKAAQGYVATDSATVTRTEYNAEGAILGSTEQVTTAHKIVPPNITAALELMKRLDPSWVPKVQLDVSGEVDHIHASVQDINVAVDYRKLSPSALKQLINSEKQPLNDEANVREVEVQPVKPESPPTDMPVKRKRGRPKGSTKLKKILEKAELERKKADEAVKKIVNKPIEKSIKRRNNNESK